MSIDPSKSYWYSRNREQRGPITGAELRQLAQTGQLQSTDLYWCEGMTDWLPLSASGAMASPGFPPSLPGTTPTTHPSMGAAQMSSPHFAPSFPCAPLRQASFGWFLGLMLGAFAVMLVGGAILGVASSNQAEPLQIVGGVIVAAGIALGFAAVVIGAINLYRAWAAIQGLAGVSTTPGMAVGLMFVPFFNLYWGFIALGKWAKDYNTFVRAHNLTAAPPANEGLFITYPILSICGLAPFISFLTVIPQVIVGIMCMAQLCSGANFLKAQSEQAV